MISTTCCHPTECPNNLKKVRVGSEILRKYGVEFPKPEILFQKPSIMFQCPSGDIHCSSGATHQKTAKMVLLSYRHSIAFYSNLSKTNAYSTSESVEFSAAKLKEA